MWFPTRDSTAIVLRLTTSAASARHSSLAPSRSAMFDMRSCPTFRMGGVGGGAEVQHAFPLMTTFGGARVGSNGVKEAV